MTVEYNAEVSTVTFSGFLKLLIKWRGSIYKLLWKEFLIFAASYTVLAVAYHMFMEGEDKKRFEAIVEYCAKFQENIPISFILGFYVNAVVTRWWEQFNSIPWPTRLSLFVTSHIRGQDERSRMIRRTLVRYVSLGYVMTMASISVPVKKRFPTNNHLVEAGFMLPNEQKTLEELHTPYNKYYVPFVWAGTLVGMARKEGRINSDFGLQAVLDEINAFRGKAQNLFNYDWVTIPLVYTQVATLAVYVFFMACLMSRQNIPTSGTGDMIFPFFTLLQFFFYVGWLKVAEELLNPFGEDDDDFDINSLIDRNLRTSYLIVDEMHEDLPELVKDQYWDKLEIQIPYTEAALEHYKEAPLGSAANMEIPEAEQQFVPEETSRLGLIEEADENESDDGKTEANNEAHDGTASHLTAKGNGTANEPPEISTPLESLVSLTSQIKDRIITLTDSKKDLRIGLEELSQKDSLKKDKTAQKKLERDSTEESKSHGESAVKKSIISENKASVAPSDQQPIVTAEKVEKLASPPPEGADDREVNKPLENEKLINSILSKLRQIRERNE